MLPDFDEPALLGMKDELVTGSVIQSMGKLRVIVKLVDAKTEANLWTKTFDKNEGDFFTIQREIAQSVAEGLSINLDSEYNVLIAKRQTKNLEAYNLYLEARLLWNTRIKKNVSSNFLKAINKKPYRFVGACLWRGLANSFWIKQANEPMIE